MEEAAREWVWVTEEGYAHVCVVWARMEKKQNAAPHKDPRHTRCVCCPVSLYLPLPACTCPCPNTRKKRGAGSGSGGRKSQPGGRVRCAARGLSYGQV